MVECVEDSFQFDAVGCVQAYFSHEKSCREVFCVSCGYYPCSSCHLFMQMEQSVTANFQFFSCGFEECVSD